MYPDEVNAKLLMDRTFNQQQIDEVEGSGCCSQNVHLCGFFQPRTEMRREFLEIVQDRLQGDPFQLHTEAVPHAPNKGARLQYQFIFNFCAPFFAFCCMCLCCHHFSLLLFDLWPVVVRSVHMPLIVQLWLFSHISSIQVE